MGIQARESSGEGIKTFVSLILFQNIFIQLQRHLYLSFSLSLPPSFFANFSFFGSQGPMWEQ